MSSHIDEAQDWDIVLDQVPRNCRVREPDAFEVEVQLIPVLVDMIRDIGYVWMTMIGDPAANHLGKHSQKPPY